MERNVACAVVVVMTVARREAGSRTTSELCLGGHLLIAPDRYKVVTGPLHDGSKTVTCWFVRNSQTPSEATIKN